MKTSEINYSDTNSFSSLVIDYLNHSPNVKPFLNRFPEKEAFFEQIREKKFTNEQRRQLYQSLQNQYAHLDALPQPVQQNLEKLQQENTYTITTGHQLSLFTGPLYFVYKIVTAIKLAQQLQQAYPDYNFVPVYWMATEDHDFAEINHFNLFGKRYEWKTEQTGAVGRFSLDGLEELLQELPEEYPLFKEAYTQNKNLADATRQLVSSLFGKYGVVCVDGDDAELKKALTPVLEKELFEEASNQQVNQVNEKLAEFYKAQIHSRPINLFYLKDNVRERIEKQEDGSFAVLNTDIKFTADEIRKLIAEHPEQFSPNVVLRPLYQELILPNLCYIGGGAEVAYWMQLKQIFEQNQVPFPIVLLRNSALYITKPNAKKRQKLEIAIPDLFKDFQELKKQLSTQLHDEEINLEPQRNQVADIFEKIEKLAAEIEQPLTKTVAAEAQKVQNALFNLEKKLSKAQDSKYETTFKQLENLKDKLFPNGSLQERVDNLLTYQTNNPEFIDELVAIFEPLKLKFTILEEEV